MIGQWTPYAQKLYDLLVLVFSKSDASTKITNLKSLQERAKLDDETWKHLVDYAAQVSVVVHTPTANHRMKVATRATLL